MLHMLAWFQALVMLLGRHMAPERPGSAVLDLTAAFAHPARKRRRDAVTFHLHPTHGDLADWLGLAVEAMGRCFTRLHQPGLITLLDHLDFCHVKPLAKALR